MNKSKNQKNQMPKKDSIVKRVVKSFKKRSKVGRKKYGTTLDRNDLNHLDWIQHAQEEAMDFVLYLEKLKQIEIKKTRKKKSK